MPANVQSMAYYGDTPWHGLGKQVRRGVTAEDMIHAAGLDWTVELRPARGAREINSKREFSRYEIVRLPRPHTTEAETLLGVVGRRYRPLQNLEAFDFFNSIVGDGKAFFETAGALGEGERIWVMARMPESMEVVPGDECFKYLLLSNSHNGDGSVTVKFTSVRVVCQNTLMLALDDGRKAYRVRHSSLMQFRLQELRDFLALTQEVFLKARQAFELLARTQMDRDRLDHYLNAVFPLTNTQKRRGERPQQWQYVTQLFESRPDLQLRGVRGTLWAAYNAITRFEDYKKPLQDEVADQRLQRSWFGTGADIKLRALDRAKAMAAQWN